MIENTEADRRHIAEEVNCKRSKSGKTLYPQYIYDPDEIVAQYREYAKRDLMQRMGDFPEDKRRQVEMSAEIYADLSAKHLAHDMPALIYFFKRYLTQH